MQKLTDFIDEIEGTGSFCTSGILKNCLPGISIKGYGELSFPVTAKEIKILKEYFKDAPYGKGTKTVIDKKVRSTKELDPKNITIANPEWNSAIDEIMQDIAVSLGLGKSRIIYSLYKMLLYMEGDFFLPHRDTEKEEKMFATLVVVLPSAHSGGDLIIKHDGKTEKYSFSAKKYLYQTGYAAFYADCEHEVKKVTEGARICLIYNLKKGTSKVQPKAFKVSETAEYAAKILKKEKTKTMKSLILLKHQYTEKNFSRDSLKNSDILKAQVLFEAAEKADYSAHLALVTMQKTYDPLSRYDDYYYDDKDEDNDNKPEIGDLIDSSLSVNQWFDSKGKSVPFGDMKLKESEIFSSEPFGKGEADEMDKED